jgi:hypothetical protein
MKTLQKIILYFLLLVPLTGIAETKEIPFTLDDRDRIIRTEQKVEALDAKVEMKVDGLRSEMNSRFDQLFSFLWAIIGIFTTMMVSVFGFAFWDRKLSMAPMKRENLKTLNALREFAEHQPKLREILKNAGLL